jgi:ribosome-associated heat shock protein Hsp15
MKRDHGNDTSIPLEAVRLDVFLDVACLFPTRSQAAATCRGGKVDVNGHAAPPHKLVRAGDTLAITMTSGRRTFVIRGLADKNLPRAEARALREETTPPPSPEVLEARRLERLLRRQPEEGGRLTKRDRREWKRLRGR